MQKNNIKNIFKQALNPGRFSVMFKKVRKRILDKEGLLSKEENLAWMKSKCSNFEAVARETDFILWEETKEISKEIKTKAEKKLSSIEYELGGGGVYPFLYFLTRYLKPDCIVETGVAAGFSSYAFLLAIKNNGGGKLYSSDFPYFRIPNPEKYIGFVVEESLKSNWSLYTDGDEANLPKILDALERIDIFHYDSDKSYSGREFAIAQIESKMSDDGIIVMDDIQDNSFFHDYVKAKNTQNWYIFEFEEKYIGLIGKL